MTEVTFEGTEDEKVTPHTLIRANTLSCIPKSICRHHTMTIEELLREVEL